MGKREWTDEERDENEGTRRLFLQKGMEAQLEKETESQIALNAAIDKALDDSDHPSAAPDAETTDKWTALKQHAKYAFPQLADSKYRDILPKHKLIAIADCEGWSKSDISEHGGISRTAIGRVLARPDIILFQREYKELQGRGDNSPKLVELANLGMGVTKRLLSIVTTDAALLRIQLDAAKWANEKAYPGGRKQTGELDAAKMMEALQSKTVQLDDDTLFDEDRKKKTKSKTIKATSAMVIDNLAAQVREVAPIETDDDGQPD